MREGALKFSLMAMVIVTLSSACATPGPLRVYSGAELPREQVARIETEIKSAKWYEDAPEAITIMSLDGKELGDLWKGWPSIIDVLPGIHEVGVKYVDTHASGLAGYIGAERANRKYDKVFTLDATAGHRYKVMFDVKYSFWLRALAERTVTYWIVDQDTQEVVSGTAPQPPPETDSGGK